MTNNKTAKRRAKAAKHSKSKAPNEPPTDLAGPANESSTNVGESSSSPNNVDPEETTIATDNPLSMTSNNGDAIDPELAVQLMDHGVSPAPKEMRLIIEIHRTNKQLEELVSLQKITASHHVELEKRQEQTIAAYKKLVDDSSLDKVLATNKQLDEMNTKLVAEIDKMKESVEVTKRYNELLLAKVTELDNAAKVRPPTTTEDISNLLKVQSTSLEAEHKIEMENARTEHEAALSALEAEKDKMNAKLLGDVVRIAASAHQENRDRESAFEQEKAALVATLRIQWLVFAGLLSFFATGLLLLFGPSCFDFLSELLASRFSTFTTAIASIFRNISQFGSDVFHQSDRPTSIPNVASISAFARLESVIAPACYETFSVAPDVVLEPISSGGFDFRVMPLLVMIGGMAAALSACFPI